MQSHVKMITMRTYIYLIFLISLFGCKSSDHKCSDTEIFLSEFTKGFSKELPPANSNILFFIKSDDNRLIKLNNIELCNLYNGSYDKKNSFKEFICNLYNEKIYLSKALIEKKISRCQFYKLDNNIERLNLALLKKNFCTERNMKLSLNQNVNESTRFTILYLFFKNKYYISFDDYNGYYLINKSLKKRDSPYNPDYLNSGSH